MLDEITKLLNKYNSNKMLVDAYFIIDVCKIVIEHDETSDFVNKIYIIDNPRGCNNHFSLVKNDLTFNLAKAHDETAKYFLDKDYYYFYNLNVLMLVFHELEHVMQEKLKEEDDLIYKEILILSDPTTFLDNYSSKLSNSDKLKLMYKWKKYHRYYTHNYYSDPQERMAIIASITKIQEIIDILNNDIQAVKNYYNFVNYQLNMVIKNGYKLKGNKTNSPTIDYLLRIPYSGNREIIEKSPILFDNDIPYDKRLYCGLHLSKEEYQNIKKLKVK